MNGQENSKNDGPDLMAIRERALSRERSGQRASLEGRVVAPRSWRGSRSIYQRPKRAAYGALEVFPEAREQRRKAAVNLAAVTLRHAEPDEAADDLRFVLESLGLTDVATSDESRHGVT